MIDSSSLYLSPSQATAYLEFGGKKKLIEPFFALSYSTQVQKKPSFSIMSKTYDYMQDGKTIVTGNLVLHYISKLFLVDIFTSLITETNRESPPATQVVLESLETAITELTSVINALTPTDPTAPVDAFQAILTGMTPTERSAIVRLLNVKRKFSVKGFTVDLNDVTYVPTFETPFGIEHINTEGLNLEIVFKNKKEFQNFKIYDVNFVQASLNFSVSDSSPLVEVYQFIARI